MTIINCRLFGSLQIKEDNNVLEINSGKIGALFCYLLIKKSAYRDELANIFWGNSSTTKAKTSLRNALHKLRGLFKADIILSPNKSILKLNEKIEFDIDVEKFIKDPQQNLNLYDIFLKNFYINDSIDFDNWIFEERNYLERLYIDTLKKNIELGFSNKIDIDILDYIKRFIYIDSYNENGYVYLLKYYKNKNRNDKVINEYHKIKNFFNEELGIDPSEQIKDYYYSAIENINATTALNSGEMYKFERIYEESLIDTELKNYLNNISYKSILISGETGVGKSYLKKSIVRNNLEKFRFFELQCYSLEKNFSFSPWLKLIKLIEKEFEKENIQRPVLWKDLLKNLFFDNDVLKQPISNILEDMENVNFNLIYIAIKNAIEILNLKKKVILVFEDLENIDNLSLKILINLILNFEGSILFFMISSFEGDDNLNNSLRTLEDLNKILNIKLTNFSKEDVDNIVIKTIGNKKSTEIVKTNIYEVTKGNPLFLNEYLEALKNGKNKKDVESRINLLLKNKFSNLNFNQREILNLMSVFYGNMNIDILIELSKLNAFELIQEVNNLIKLNIIEENSYMGDKSLAFSNSQYKNYIYSELNDISKRIIHKKIAEILEDKFIYNDSDITSYIKLKYHFDRSNELLKSLKYEVYILNYHLNFNHEIYPNIDDCKISQRTKLFLNDEKINSWIKSIEKDILSIKSKFMSEDKSYEIQEIELIFLYCKGRYLIRCGKYSEGLKTIDLVINLSDRLKNLYIKLQAHKQKIIYGIQINNSNIMLNNIILSLKLSKELNDDIEKGIIYRLYGVYNMMINNFVGAEMFFRKSIKILTESGTIANLNSISIAANYNYIGEIKRSNLDLNESMDYFNKAIDLCKETEASCLSIFYINAAKSSFFISDFESMKKYLNISKRIIENFDSYWKAPVLYGFLSLSYFLDKQYEDSLNYLKKAINEISYINNPKDIGEIYFIKTLLKSYLYDTDDLTELGKFLNKSISYYYYKSMEYLDEYKNFAEINYLQKNLKNFNFSGIITID